MPRLALSTIVAMPALSNASVNSRDWWCTTPGPNETGSPSSKTTGRPPLSRPIPAADAPTGAADSGSKSKMPIRRKQVAKGMVSGFPFHYSPTRNTRLSR